MFYSLRNELRCDGRVSALVCLCTYEGVRACAVGPHAPQNLILLLKMPNNVFREIQMQRRFNDYRTKLNQRVFSVMHAAYACFFLNDRTIAAHFAFHITAFVSLSIQVRSSRVPPTTTTDLQCNSCVRLFKQEANVAVDFSSVPLLRYIMSS